MMKPIEKTEIAPGVAISKISYGCAPIGGLFSAAAEQTSINAIQAALAQGINYFDSALLYGGGKSLETLGVGLGEYPPADTVLSFKVGRVLVDRPEDVPAGKEPQPISEYEGDGKRWFYYDYSKEGVKKAFEQSLDHLNRGRRAKGWEPLTQQNTNFAVLVHDPGRAEHPATQPAVMRLVLDEAFPELLKMQKAGTIKAYGVGTNEIRTALETLADPNISLVLPAGRFTALCNNAPTAPREITADSGLLPELLAQMRKHPNKPKIIAAAIGNSGLGYGGPNYNYRSASERVIDFRDKVRNAVKNYNESHSTDVRMNDVLVQYPLIYGDDLVATCMPGPRNVSEVEQAATSYHTQIPQELWQSLESQGLISSPQQAINPVTKRGARRQ